MTTCVVYVLGYTKCTQTLKIIPYPGFRFRYTLPVPTVKWVHFLYLKPLVCILFSMGAIYRMSVLKIWYLHNLGFRYR
jgi:hypothetical protein